MKLRHATFLLSAVFAGAVVAQTEQAQDGAPSEVEAFLSSLAWMSEPGQQVPIGDNAMLTLRPGFVALNAADTARFNEFSENPVSGDEYMFAPDDLRWFAFLNYDPVGYVKDDESIDADDVLDTIREGTEAANEIRKQRGWSTMEILGWRFPPSYDQRTQRLEWAIDAVSEGRPLINFNTRILGRKGVYEAILVTDPEGLDTAVQEFNSQLASFDFNAGHRYAEYQSGDHVAEYGLAALVAGGAAAAVVKSGAGKGLFKLLAAGGVAVLAFGGMLLKKLLGRKS